MKQYLPFLSFLIKFFSSYIILTLIYKFYLSQFDIAIHEVDGITQAVSAQVERSSRLFNQDIEMIPSRSEAAIRVVFNGQIVAKIVEGCNSISIILLFISFIIAFSTSLSRTAAYALAGSFALYVINILRIDWFVWALYHYPEQQQLLHDVIFPLILYGCLLLLWFGWIFKFSKK